tara:strand:+ start:251 stop:769 length:519 start_codon:yes stop_codon:yes gene_type:complete
MMRIISGIYRGQSLSRIPFQGTRPTQARVRKSMLQILEPFEGKKVLDLFAGSGILGIEALSRGADSLVSIENDKKIFKILNNNLIKICKDKSYQPLFMDAINFLNRCNQKFDIIISDPPYNQYDYMDIFNKSIPLINKGGIFCMEMRKKEVDENVFRKKIYGNTQIILWEAN